MDILLDEARLGESREWYREPLSFVSFILSEPDIRLLPPFSDGCQHFSQVFNPGFT